MFDDCEPISKEQKFFMVYNCTERRGIGRCYKTPESAQKAAINFAENNPGNIIAVLEPRNYWRADKPEAKIL